MRMRRLNPTTGRMETSYAIMVRDHKNCVTQTVSFSTKKVARAYWNANKDNVNLTLLTHENLFPVKKSKRPLDKKNQMDL